MSLDLALEEAKKIREARDRITGLNRQRADLMDKIAVIDAELAKLQGAVASGTAELKRNAERL